MGQFVSWLKKSVFGIESHVALQTFCKLFVSQGGLTFQSGFGFSCLMTFYLWWLHHLLSLGRHLFCKAIASF